MSAKCPLSKRQRQILALMLENGVAAFPGGTRKFFHQHGTYGLLIYAYQTPEFFLASRGLLERVESNAPGYWYRLTDQGARRARKLTRRER